MNKAQYDAGVAMIRERNPGESLLRTLLGGHTPVNEVYLRAAMRRLPAIKEKQMAAPPMGDIPHQRDQRYADEVLKGLWGERSRLFGEMNKASNHFHDCKSDDERAANSRTIRRIWGLILDVKEKIAYYEQHGALPEPVSEERFPLPDDTGALVNKRNSIRAQISQAKRRLDELGALPNDHPDRVKIADAEGRLAELKLYLGHAENRIERASVFAE